MPIDDQIAALAKKYAVALKQKIDQRMLEMQQDDKSHYLIYRVLGISPDESDAIDLYQNKGRFLYKYTGGFLEEAARLCFQERFPDALPVKIPNTLGARPKTFEIDCLLNDRFAYEVKWRDATTDGDHITKEHTRIQAIAAAGYMPIRLMFYAPLRQQAARIQLAIAALHKSVGGEYYAGEDAWLHLASLTGVDLRSILQKIADQEE